MATQEDVEFRTIDGIKLRGYVFAAKEKGPGIVMCPGFNAVKEMVGLPSVALAFQEAGITVLLYDPRSVGISDGEPRNDINPFQEIEDFSDALTFLSTHPRVDPKRVGLWGMSLAGATALCAASFDKRARFVVSVCPATEYHYTESKLPSVLAKIAKDRESQAKGNPPFYIPMLTQTGENPAGFNLGLDKEAAMRLVLAQDESISTRAALAPNHVNRTTIQTYKRLLMWNPSYMWKHLSSTAVMFLVPELDQLIGADTQVKHFERLPGPKRLHLQKGRGHMDILEGDTQPEVLRQQIAFVMDALEGRVEQ